MADQILLIRQRRPWIRLIRAYRRWYIHFASLFYIITYYYSLIYFTFRDDTYVVPLILYVWWSLEDCCRNQDSAGKRIVKTPYFGRLRNSRKIPGNYILPEDWRSQKEEARGATRQTHTQGARPDPWPRWPVVWPPWPTSAIAPLCIWSSLKT
jgi:hypothetical protein